MNALLLTAVLTVGQQPAASPAAGGDATSIEGQWTVICYEKNGQPMAEAKDAKVTVRNNTITFEGKDKMKAMRVQFLPNGMVRVTETDAAPGTDRTGSAAADDKAGTGGRGGAGDGKSGVYVLTQEYLAVCLHDDAPGTAKPGTERQGTDRANATGGGPMSKTYCTVILKRTGGTDRR